jgi:hypothetical protein
LDPLVPNQVRYRTAPHSEEPNHNGWARPGQGQADLFMKISKRRLPVFQDMRLWATQNSSDSVNPTLSLQHDIVGQGPSRLMAGLALSFALHAALLFAWRQGQPAQRAADAGPQTPITVWLRPPPPKAEPAPASASATKSTPAARPRRRAPPEVIALPQQTPAAAARPDAFTVEPPVAPRFDPEAARKLARQLADEPDPAKAGTALAQLPPKPLATETRAARAIAGAKRRDCKDGIPGGLLAPLYLMMDKKDSGCKW